MKIQEAYKQKTNLQFSKRWEMVLERSAHLLNSLWIKYSLLPSKGHSRDSSVCLFFFKCLSIYLTVMLLCCTLELLVVASSSLLRIKPWPPALTGPSLSHWTTREVPRDSSFDSAFHVYDPSYSLKYSWEVGIFTQNYYILWLFRVVWE